ncbi:hypothetical protein, partial [Klebsiella pneumoniae]|uniref:hypothetical protein n=1 Tax=Klebsiella pneumoniae TaxID=573 RepID=UPI001D0E6FC5
NTATSSPEDALMPQAQRRFLVSGTQNWQLRSEPIHSIFFDQMRLSHCSRNDPSLTILTP